MEFTASQIANVIDGRIIGDENTIINGVSPIELGEKGHLSFVAHEKFADFIENSDCSVLIVSEKLLADKPYKPTIIVVEDAYLSFQILMNIYNEMKQVKRSEIEHSAFVNNSATIGEDVYVGAFTYVSEKAKIGDGSQIYPQVFIGKNVKIGKNCTILSNTRIENSLIENNVKIESSLIKQSKIEGGVTIGPFAHLRPKSYVQEEAHIGNFVEIKNSTLEKGVKTGHLTYIGDAVVGENTNIGAGTITCNYDGKNKHKTVIGKESFIGSNSVLVAPVNLGKEVYTAAGSVITKNVPDKTLAFGRAKQTNKEGWKK